MKFTHKYEQYEEGSKTRQSAELLFELEEIGRGAHLLKPKKKKINSRRIKRRPVKD